MNVHFTTTNGELNGRASHFYKDIHEAGKVCANQNTKAEEMGIKSRYGLSDIAESDIPQNEKAR